MYGLPTPRQIATARRILTTSRQIDMKSSKKWYVHVLIIVAMFAAACAYMSPVLGGKALPQGDTQKFEAMARAQKEAAKQTGHVPTWAPSMFSGMPGYQITGEQQKSVFTVLKNSVSLYGTNLMSTIGVLFLYLLGFYVAMIALGVSPLLALLGAIGFGLGSYNIIIIEAGHITKAWAMSMMAPIFAGMMLTLRSAIDADVDRRTRRRRVLWGSLLFTLSLILQISFNHIQITFYTALGCVAMGLVYLVYALMHRRFAPFALKVGILVAGAALAFGCNLRLLLVNEEYARYTMRGGNELTVTPADLYGEREAVSAQNPADGLDISYAFNWSYGIGETYTLLVPGAKGGGSGERVGESSSFYKNFRSQYAPLYWGDQPFTSGPVYFGAIIVLLFFMGLIVCKGPDRWWLLLASVLAILLSWGSNFMDLNGWIFNHVPFYNKFRTPSMALVLANVCMVIMAVLTLKNVMDKERDVKRVNIGLYVATGLLSVILLVVLMLSGSFSFSGVADQEMAKQYGNNWEMIRSVLVDDRASLFRADTWRSLLFILLAAVVLWLYNNGKLLKNSTVAVVALGVLVLIDLFGVDRRYLTNDNFVDKRKVELKRDQWDFEIDEQAARYGDHDYRVFNLAVNTFNDSKPSAFHNQVGGYSAAKLSRYQNLIDFYINNRHVNPQVLAMLNTRYVVLRNGQVQRMPDAMGNCWLVGQVNTVGSANDEILALNTTDLATTAVVDTSKFPLPSTHFDTTGATIALEPQRTNNPDYLKYTSHAASDQLAVFSEIHYSPDWFAYIDGKRVDYLRANYVLRALVVPAGDHVIEFKNEAPRLHRLDNLTLVVSIITLLLMAGAIFLVYKKERKSC